MAWYFLDGLMPKLNFLRSAQDIRAFIEKELEAHQGLGKCKKTCFWEIITSKYVNTEPFLQPKLVDYE